MNKIRTNDVPSSLDLLPMPFAFSQRPLLRVGRFKEEAQKRGFSVDWDTLECLHRCRALIPMFRLYSRKVVAGQDRIPDKQIIGKDSFLYQRDLYVASSEGRLRDPLEIRFRPWPKSWRNRGGIRYSWFQLLSLRDIASIIDQVKSTARLKDNEIVYDTPRLQSWTIERAAKMRTLAIVLESLSTRYTPRILRYMSTADPDRLSEYLRSPLEIERHFLSRIEPTLLLEQANTWLYDARSFDPLGLWHKVVRTAKPRRWKDLKFDALNAIELRIAAEMLIRYYEDLAVCGHVEPLERIRHTYYTEYRTPGGYHILDSRLKEDDAERADTLQSYGFENVPAVVVAVEGYTEMKILPRVLEMVDANSTSGLVGFINLKGVAGDVKLVARSVAVPKLYFSDQPEAQLLRPLTALVVVVDPEGKYDTPQKVEQQRTLIINEIVESQPEEYRTTALRLDIEELVMVETWGNGGCFEFANFSDKELAKAIREIAQKTPSDVRAKVPDIEEIEKQLSQTRNQRKDVKTVWSRWGCSFSKIDLVEELWSILRAKILSEDEGEVPIARIAIAIVNLAYKVRRVNLICIKDSD